MLEVKESLLGDINPVKIRGEKMKLIELPTLFKEEILPMLEYLYVLRPLLCC